jgi:hypothetical protein
VGFLLIFLAPAIRLYAFPRIEKAPTDVFDDVVSQGSGSYLQISRFSYNGPVPLRNDQHLKGITSASSSDVAVIDQYSTVTDLTRGKVVDYTPERYVFDRVTALPVHCCGEFPRHEGYTLKLPFNLEKKTYPLWDDTAKMAFPAVFSGTDTIDGLPVYEFKSHAENVVIDPDVSVPASYVGKEGGGFHAQLRYTQNTTVWVEPVSGAIIKGSQQAARWFADPATGDPLALVSNTVLTWSPAYVAKTAGDIDKQVKQLRLVKVWIPIVGPALGVVLVLLALLLLRRRESPHREPSIVSQPEAQPG